MAKLLKLRRGSTSQHSSFTGAEGEVTIDTTKDTAVVHDGSQAGGRPLAREDMSNVSSASIAGQLGTDSIAVGKIAAGTLPTDVKIADANVSGNLTIESADIVDGTIVNADINASAAIARTKLANVDVVDDTTPQLGGNLDTNGKDVAFKNAANNATTILFDASQDALEVADNASIVFGDHPDVAIAYSNGNDFSIAGQHNGSGDIVIGHKNGAGTIQKSIKSVRSTQAVELYYGDSKKLETTSTGATVTGTLDSGNLTITGVDPVIHLVDSNHNSDYSIYGNGGVFTISDTTNTADRFEIQSDGTVDIAGNLDANGGLDVTGNSEFIGDVKFDGATAGSDIIFDRSDNSLTFADDTKIRIGNSQDLDIYHDGTYNRIESGSTTLFVRSNLIEMADNSGNLYIKCIDGGATELYHNANKKLETTSAGVTVTGALTATGNVTAFSDSRLKTEIHTIEDPLEKVDRLRGVTFKWLHTDKPSSGVIAQEVQEVFPELVEATTHEGKEVLSVDYGKLVGVLIESIKELKAEFEAHKAECAKQHGGE